MLYYILYFNDIFYIILYYNNMTVLYFVLWYFYVYFSYLYFYIKGFVNIVTSFIREQKNQLAAMLRKYFESFFLLDSFKQYDS